MSKRKGLFVLEPYWFQSIYAVQDREELREWLDFPNRAFSPKEIEANPDLLRNVEILFSGWYGGPLTREILDAAPRLRAVFFGGGSVRWLATEAFWERDIVLSSAAAANAVPVAEFTLAQIILALKRAHWYGAELRRTREYPRYDAEEGRVAGAYRSTVGIVSLGLIGRRVRELLRLLDVRVVAYDPFVAEEEAARLGVELVPLDELFRVADVVTLHTPLLEETRGLVSADLVGSMKPGAALVNTSRGAVIDEEGLIAVLRRRADLSAVLDVTAQEPPPKDSPLYALPNVVLTPHIAGSQYGECRRMGRWMIEEAQRFLSGKPLRWQITRERAALLA
ncbi:MAG TPA: hydroxyacid dehydrogenase [Candidatus Methylacidiphilales bacterium]